MTTLEHTVKSYDEELKKLQQDIASMGSLAESELQNAMQALIRRNADLGSQVVLDDARVDELEQLAGAQVVRSAQSKRTGMTPPPSEAAAGVRLAAPTFVPRAARVSTTGRPDLPVAPITRTVIFISSLSSFSRFRDPR